MPCAAQFADSTKVSVPKFARPAAKVDLAALRENILRSAKDIAANPKGKIGFAPKPLADTQVFNAEFWKPARPADGVWEVRPDKDAAAAVLNIVDEPGKYRLECASAIKFVLNLALVRTLGSSRFNGAVKDAAKQDGHGLQIGYGGNESLLVRALYSSNPEPAKFPGMAKDGDGWVDGLPAGAAVYMINLAPTPEGVSAGWRGENAISLGGDNFFAHGLKDAPFPVKGAFIRQHIVDSGYWDKSAAQATAPGASRAGVPNGSPWFVKEYSVFAIDQVQQMGCAKDGAGQPKCD